jgi:hypothetical protein
MRRSLWSLHLFFVIGASTFACGGPGDGQAPPEAPAETAEVGTVKLALTTVPTGIQCIQVSADMSNYPWAHLATQSFASTPGAAWTGTVQLGSFAWGQVLVTAQAYNVACASIGATPTWQADPIVINLTPGAPGISQLNFRQNYGIVATANFAPSVTSVSLGTYTTGLLLADNTVRIVGNSSVGVSTPTSLTNVVELAVGYSHACGRKSDGTVWCWGQNNYGQLGNGTTTNSLTTPVQVSGITGATTVAVGSWISCASTSLNTTYCWGYNAYGALGNGTTTNSSTPSLVSGINGSAKIATSFAHTCAVTNDGGTYCWGFNGAGALGNGGTVNSTVPVLAAGVRGAVSVAVGDNHSCAATSTGAAYCWGANISGQIGNNSTTAALTPNLVSAISGTVVELSAGIDATCAVTAEGLVYCWGNGASGTVGDGSGLVKLAPVQILSGARQVRIGASGLSACALMQDVSVQCWGSNLSGQLGDGTFTSRFKPVPMQL